MINPKMLDCYKRLLMAADSLGGIVKTTMDGRYISIDIADGNNTYLLTVMVGKKEGDVNAE